MYVLYIVLSKLNCAPLHIHVEKSYFPCSESFETILKRKSVIELAIMTKNVIFDQNDTYMFMSNQGRNIESTFWGDRN
jgi:hypothetical protein